jgi:hypothetical protein
VRKPITAWGKLLLISLFYFTKQHFDVRMCLSTLLSFQLYKTPLIPENSIHEATYAANTNSVTKIMLFEYTCHFLELFR